MKKCKVILIFILIIMITGSSFLTYRFTIDSKQDEYLRQVDYEESKNNPYLDSLYVYDGKLEPEFNDETREYKVLVPSGTNKLKISYRVQSKYSQAWIEENENLKNGSVVKVGVRANNGLIVLYNLTVVYTNSKLIMRIIMILLALIIIAAIALLILYYLQTNGYINIEFKKKVKVENGNYVK